jgi:hypothetical protein
MIEKFKKYLVKAQSPAYPPYHTGPYLEEYFLYYYFKNIEKFKNVKHQYIPVLWTELYLHVASLVDDLQNDLNELDKEKFYFTVSQHDDAPFQQLPPNTINFSAGGNQPNTIPIPLICSPITDVKEVEKDIFCSFVGSITAPLEGWGLVSHNLRMKMLETLVDKKEYVLKPKSWTNEVKKERQDLFLDLTARSKFTLCPRGYGATSFRLYEAMQLKSVPVYIYYEKPHLPFVDRINWNDICVLINIDDIGKLDDTLKNISDEKYANMVKTMQETYQKYFTLEGMCNGILETLENIK